MLPKIEDDLKQAFTVGRIQPSLTYELDITKARVAGKVDERKAIQQAIYKILNTERYQYLIYSWNYGVELKELIGKPSFYVIPETERRITEALMQDERISGVDAFSFETERNKLQVSFTVHTIYGEIEIEREVRI